MKRSSLSIRAQLFIVVVAVAAPLAALLIWTIVADFANTVAQAKAAAHTLAVVTASDTDRTLRTYAKALERIAERPLVRALDERRCDPALRDFHPLFPASIDVATLGLSGNLICSAVLEPGAKVPSVAGTAWFKQAITEDRTVVGDPVLGPISGRWGSVLAHPLHDEAGQLRGLLVLPLDLAVYVPNISTAPLAPGTIVGIVTANGTIVWRNVDPEKWIGQNAGGNETIRRVIATGSGETEGIGVDSASRLYAVEKIAGADWYVYVGLQTDMIYANAYAAAVRNGGLGLASLVAVIGLAMFLSRRIERPIRALVATARAIREGRAESRAEIVGAREIAELAGEFNLMLDHSKEFERRLRDVFNEVRLLTAMLDQQGNLTFANQTLLDITGWTLDEVIGKNWFHTFRPPEQRAEHFARFLADMPTGKIAQHYEGEIIARDGRRYLIDWNHTLMHDLAGNPVGVASIGQDITEARKAEKLIRDSNETLARSMAQTRASEERLRRIFEMVPDPLSIVDMVTGTYLDVSRSWEEQTGFSRDEVIGRSPKEIFHYTDDDLRQLFEMAEAAATNGGRRQTREWQLRRKDGSLRTFAISASTLESGAQRVGLWLSRDVTERKALEEQLRQSQRMEAIGKLTGGVAHDFNNLLGVISGSLELIDEALVGQPDIREMLQAPMRATHRGATLTRSLLAFSRQQPLAPRVVDINGLVREVTELVRRTVTESIEIELVTAATWPCEADPGQLQNALLNLIVNAQDAMPEGGRLTIETGEAVFDGGSAAQAGIDPGEYVMVAVSDTGTGMPPDVVARVFEPFFTTKGLDKGTGLGLSMVYGFVQQSRGHVRVQSEVGHGTTVRIYLPRSAVDVERRAAPVAAIDAQLRGGETVLMVEDDTDMRELVGLMLHKLGYQVLAASAAPEALSRLRKTKQVSLLLTDVVLRGDMNGRQLAEAALRLRPDLRVLYMSGYTEDAILHHGRLDRGVHVLQKPFSKDELAAKLRELLDAVTPR